MRTKIFDVGHRGLEEVWSQYPPTGLQTPFSSRWWCEAWSEAFGDSADGHPVLAVGRQGDSVVALPMLLCEVSGRTRFRAFGGGWADYSEALCPDDQEGALLLARTLQDLAQESTIDIEDVRSTGPLSAAARILSWDRRSSSKTFAIDFIESEHLGRVTRRRAYLKKRRRLARLGEIDYRCTVNQDEMLHTLPTFSDMFTHRWTSENECFGPFSDPRVLHYFTLMIERGAKYDGAFMATLRGNSELLAVYFGLQTAAWRGCYRTAFREDYATYSPGHLLLIELIENSATHGWRGLDLMRGEHSYKNEYCNATKNNLRLTSTISS